MTVPAQEILEYRGDKYYLIGGPLDSLLEIRKDIQFDIYGFTTAHKWGYQGYWKLENNKLYITNLESANYEYRDIFNTSEPIFADWFSGSLKFGFGNFRPNYWWGNYENYLWLNFQNGIVVERKIVNLFYDDSQLKFEFGKYKNKNFNDVIQGKIYRNTYTTLKEFIEELLKLIIQKETNYRIQAPSCNLTEEDVKLVEEVRKLGINYFLTQNYLAFSALKFWENNVIDKRADRISILLEKILSSDFSKTALLGKKGLEELDISEKSILINPDLEYIIWAIKKVDSFFIPPNFFNKMFKLKKIKTLKITRLNSTIFEYRPVVEEFEYKFPEYIIKINNDKFKKKTNLNYIEDKDHYEYDLSEEDLMSKFGFYLDESYKENIDLNSDKHPSNNYITDNDYRRNSYGTYSGSYAQEYEGLSDNYIDDVFGGDPEAYWNID